MPFTQNGIEQQDVGSNINTWGLHVNGALARLNYLYSGCVTLTLTGDRVLTSGQDFTGAQSTFEAYNGIHKLAGSPSAVPTLQVPSVAMQWLVQNGSTKSAIYSLGGGTTATLLAGECVPVWTDGVGVYRLKLLTMGGDRLQNVGTPTAGTDAATKNYVDQTAFGSMTGTFPGQGSAAGQFLTTDGTNPFWSAVPTSSITDFSAVASAIRAGTTTAAALTPGDSYAALAEVPLTSSGGSIAVDLATFINASHTLTENTTLANPTNPKVGQSGYIRLTQHASAAKTLSFGGNWKRVGGAASLSTTLSAVDVLEYQVLTSTFILYDLLKAPSA